MNADKKLALLEELGRATLDREGWTVRDDWPMAYHVESGFAICAYNGSAGWRWRLLNQKEDLAKQAVGEDTFLALSCMATWLGLQIESRPSHQTLH